MHACSCPNLSLIIIIEESITPFSCEIRSYDYIYDLKLDVVRLLVTIYISLDDSYIAGHFLITAIPWYACMSIGQKVIYDSCCGSS